MDNCFSQPKVTHKIYFSTYYKDLELFEEFFEREEFGCLGVSIFELKFESIDAKPEDLWCFEAYLAKEPEMDGLRRAVYDFAERNRLKIVDDLKLEIVEDKDWVTEYQKQLKPLELGRFFIASQIHLTECPSGKSPIILEASRAFGTGQHYTTSSCLEAMEYLGNCDFRQILDVGTGSGILSFAAEYIWPKAEIMACDIDEVAVEIANLNKAVNNSKVSFFQNKGSELELSKQFKEKFDLIISNILAGPLAMFAEDFAALSQGGTRLILSGFLESQLSELVGAYEAKLFEVEKVINNNKWITLTMIKL